MDRFVFGALLGAIMFGFAYSGTVCLRLALDWWKHARFRCHHLASASMAVLGSVCIAGLIVEAVVLWLDAGTAKAIAAGYDFGMAGAWVVYAWLVWMPARPEETAPSSIPPRDGPCHCCR